MLIARENCFIRVFRSGQLNNFAQLTTAYLAAFVSPPHRGEPLDEYQQDIDLDTPADLVGITCNTSHCHGRYPPTWLSNLLVSSVLYVLAGLFWNLECIPGRGVVFAFMEEKWPGAETRSSFARVADLATLCMVLVGLLIGYFILDYLRSAPR